MPGLDGWETLAAVRGDPRTAHVPVAFCSSGMEPQDVQRAWDLGTDGVFAKPIDIGRMVREVREILARPGPGGYGRATSPQ
jgi:CheY-like chemotaxis protein